LSCALESYTNGLPGRARTRTGALASRV